MSTRWTRPNRAHSLLERSCCLTVCSLRSKHKVVDLSADYRFDKSWAYGMPERKGQREHIKKSARISNPGCYATGSRRLSVSYLDR